MPPRPKAPQIKSFSIPDYYLDEWGDDLPDGFQEAFNHAKSHKNPDKAALLYAEAHYEDHAKEG
ncbi:MAG TPA: hypothetical protein VH593_19240 [Ktedonobacteraceae bacterium]|jgi:hypothetical protein